MKCRWTRFYEGIDLIIFEGKQCPYCGRHMTKAIRDREPTRDHVVPEAFGGRLVRGNVLICCSRCNHQKANRTLPQFGRWLRELGEHRRASMVFSVRHKLDDWCQQQMAEIEKQSH